MSMVVRTNSMAMSANSALNKNNSTVAGNLQKLSTGFRINRAADDASGLAVSEKMKAQIKALDQAGKNAQDGASLIKTAEGYMGEIHDMLNRIVELAEKSANGTYEVKEGKTALTEEYGDTGVDRQAIQDEVDQLTTEIDRIASTANFNGLKLLNGNLAMTKTDGTAAVTGKPAVTGDTVTGKFVKSGDNYVLTTDTEAQKDTEYFTIGDEQKTSQADKTFAENTAYYTYDAETGYTKATDVSAENWDTKKATLFTLAPADVTISKVHEDEVQAQDGTPDTFAGGLKLQIGETSDSVDKLTVSIDSFATSELFKDLDSTVQHSNDSDAAGTAGITGLTINVSNQDSASKAAEDVRKVINEVSSRRATLGAMENRIDYTMNNLDTASQNITDANSRIRDTDMAKTMMQYTQGNTLTQAAQAMLAQANQAPSQVLQLLQ